MDADDKAGRWFSRPSTASIRALGQMGWPADGWPCKTTNSHPGLAKTFYEALHCECSHPQAISVVSLAASQ
jgi:hypothetical protein